MVNHYRGMGNAGILPDDSGRFFGDDNTNDRLRECGDGHGDCSEFAELFVRAHEEDGCNDVVLTKVLRSENN